MTTEWPSSREDQIQTIRTLSSDIAALERQYVPATITDVDNPTEDQLQIAWSSVHDGSPQLSSKVMQLDSSGQRILNTYSAIPYFSKVFPTMQSNWELLDSFRQGYGDGVTDFDSVTLSQDFERLVLLAKVRSLKTGLRNTFNVRFNGVATALYDHTRLTVFGNRDLTAPGYDNAFISNATSFNLSYAPAVSSDPYSSARIQVEFPFYSDPDTPVEMRSSIVVMSGDMDSSAGVDYYQYVAREELYGYHSTPANITQLNVLSGTGFAEGTNFQIFGVNRK